ncbi:MAG: hypothetical protein QM493_07765 [Sulfurovum sp.]
MILIMIPFTLISLVIAPFFWIGYFFYSFLPRYIRRKSCGKGNKNIKLDNKSLTLILTDRCQKSIEIDNIFRFGYKFFLNKNYFYILLKKNNYKEDMQYFKQNYQCENPMELINMLEANGIEIESLDKNIKTLEILEKKKTVIKLLDGKCMDREGLEEEQRIKMIKEKYANYKFKTKNNFQETKHKYIRILP